MDGPDGMPMDLNLIPAMAPPEGQVPNFENPSVNQAPAYIAVAAVFMALTVFFAGVRFWARFFVQRAPWWDDLFIFLALLCQGAYIGLAIWLSLHGVGRHMWDVSVASVMKLIEPGRAIGDVTEPAIGFTKLGLLLFYYKLFAVNDLTRIGSLVGMAVVVPLYTALFFVFVFMDEASAWKANKAMAVFNIVTDFYLLVLPLTAVVWLRMERRKKIGLIVIFSSGFLACILSIVGAVYRFRAADDPDFTWVLSNVYLVNTIECCVGIICACVPFLPALAKKSPITADWMISLKSLRDRILSAGSRGSRGNRSHPSANDYAYYGNSKDRNASGEIDPELGGTASLRPPTGKSSSKNTTQEVGLDTIDVIDSMPGLYGDERSKERKVRGEMFRMDPTLQTQTETRVGSDGESGEGVKGGIEVKKGYAVTEGR
ncbi:uncharacterized protein PODANS_5_1270 [Podospora anserina S mat+]|uniref:Podospora anserina S mat+ genomic DNA chromosome 5, supercontig 1 n=1 Tax=Podospora anserina (strain S / ATCC MYA-4624 / DSM 980 / FGSC 10383) TaxID=515849 RepID=B2AEW9_PODAN|nr:uncharacterized protein PODANS_5_1270 [Podospora anserina S mat+]CAP61986.1 unnamed protein product [Podospora anserina S mat+]CDP29062.1 Putative protein of unknown function [Podospora anserina S mat+]